MLDYRPATLQCPIILRDSGAYGELSRFQSGGVCVLNTGLESGL